MLNCRPWSHNCHVTFSYISKAIFNVLWRGAIPCIFILSLCLTPGAARSQMSQLSDEDIRGISGQSGVSIMMDGVATVHYDLISFSDTQTHPNYIELKDFNVDNGSAGGAFSFATLYNPSPLVLEPKTIDIATDGNGRTFITMVDTSQMNPRRYIVNDLELKYWSGSTYYEQPLGSIELDALRQGPSVYNLWAHTAGGISFDYATTISADALTYTYNTTTPEALSLSKIHIAGSATGDPKDPYDLDHTGDPWVFSGTFKIGTIGDASNAPATIDVATDAGVTSLSLNLPMAGTIRVAEVIFGTNTVSSDPNFNSNFAEGAPLNFGPIAIDGIQVHRLNVKISP